MPSPDVLFSTYSLVSAKNKAGYLARVVSEARASGRGGVQVTGDGWEVVRLDRELLLPLLPSLAPDLLASDSKVSR